MRPFLLALLLALPGCTQAPISYGDDDDDDEESDESAPFNGGEIGNPDQTDTPTLPSDTGWEDTGTHSTTTTTTTTTTGGTPCSGSRPTLTATCENGGMSGSGDDASPVLMFVISAQDNDGDLNSYGIDLDYESNADGVLDSAGLQRLSLTGSVDAELCYASDLSLNLHLSVDGAAVLYSTQYDWGITLTDANGLASEPFVLTCRTPASDGSGDP